jgi:hypothetical protein
MQVGRGKPNPMSHPLDGKVWVGEIFLDAAADALQVVSLKGRGLRHGC